MRSEPHTHVVLTGASGFIGSAVKDAFSLLHPRRHVLGISHLDQTEASLAKNRPDVGADTLLLFGASVPKSRALMSDTAAASRSLGTLDALLNLAWPNLRSCVLASTLDVFGEQSGLLSASSMPAPSSAYGRSKLAAEERVMAFAAERGLSATVLRIGSVFGPRDTSTSKLVPTLVRAFRSEQPVVFSGSGHQSIRLLYVWDLARAVVGYVEAADSHQEQRIRSQAFVCAGWSPTSPVQVFEELQQISGIYPPVSHTQERKYSVVEVPQAMIWGELSQETSLGRALRQTWHDFG